MSDIGIDTTSSPKHSKTNWKNRFTSYNGGWQSMHLRWSKQHTTSNGKQKQRPKTSDITSERQLHQSKSIIKRCAGRPVPTSPWPTQQQYRITRHDTRPRFNASKTTSHHQVPSSPMLHHFSFFLLSNRSYIAPKCMHNRAVALSPTVL